MGMIRQGGRFCHLEEGLCRICGVKSQKQRIPGTAEKGRGPFEEEVPTGGAPLTGEPPLIAAAHWARTLEDQIRSCLAACS